jgi:hypothetical protein
MNAQPWADLFMRADDEPGWDDEPNDPGRRARVAPVADRTKDRTNTGLSLDAFIAEARHGPDMLIPGIVPAAGLTIYAGEPRSFKTFGALQLALAVATGKPYLGREPLRSGGVLYVSEEGAASKLADRFERLQATFEADPAAVRVMHRTGVVLTDPEAWDRVRQAVNLLHHPALVILDTLAALSSGDENAADSMRDALRPVGQLIADTGVSIVLVHHTNKNGGQERPGGRLRGSSVLWGASDSVVTFQRATTNGEPEDAGTIIAEPKDGDAEKIAFRWSWETFLLDVDPSPRCTPQNIADEAARLSIGQPVSADALHRAFAGAGRSWFRQQVSRAVHDGLLTRVGSGPATGYLPATPASLFGRA